VSVFQTLPSRRGAIEAPADNFRCSGWMTGNAEVTPKMVLCPDWRHPCKSMSSEKHETSGRAGESAHYDVIRTFPSAVVASRLMVPALAEPDIHLLSKTPKSPHRRLSLCPLPVPKQFIESLRSLTSIAQSPNGGTWQPAHRNHPDVFPS
jgi:hypothetical protein